MSFTKLYYHIVFSPKDRQTVIGPNVERDLYIILYNVMRKYNGEVIRIGGMPDHVHILIGIPATIAVSKFAQAVKRESSASAVAVIEGWPGWQEGYGAFTCSYENLPQIKRYILNQKEHHKKISFRDEYRNWLLENGVSPDEPYFPK
ncbi:MAG: IS200/IS605 family transposase [Muribaculum sp.]|nr:IS200/IS605 family transposase [Muribaculum sp.]